LLSGLVERGGQAAGGLAVAHGRLLRLAVLGLNFIGAENYAQLSHPFGDEACDPPLKVLAAHLATQHLLQGLARDAGAARKFHFGQVGRGQADLKENEPALLSFIRWKDIFRSWWQNLN